MDIERIPTHIIPQPLVVADATNKRFWQQATSDPDDNEWYEITPGPEDYTRWVRICGEMIRAEDANRFDA